MASLPDGYAKRFNNPSNNPFARTTPVGRDAEPPGRISADVEVANGDPDTTLPSELKATQADEAAETGEIESDVEPLPSMSGSVEAAVIPIAASKPKAKAKATRKQVFEQQVPQKLIARAAAEVSPSSEARASLEPEVELPEYRLSVRLSGTTGVALERERQRRRERGEKVNVSDVVRKIVDSWAASQRK